MFSNKREFEVVRKKGCNELIYHRNPLVWFCFVWPLFQPTLTALKEHNTPN